MKLNVSAFALAFGIWWGAGIFLMTWWLIVTGGTNTGPMMLDNFYIGYSVTPVGSFIGLGYGLVCGAICGAVFAWLYNFLAGRIGASPQG